LLVFHIYLLATNQTTLECGINLAEYWVSRHRSLPYHRGLINNIESVFGKNRTLWPFPVRPEPMNTTVVVEQYS
jgi:hypothetical protein